MWKCYDILKFSFFLRLTDIRAQPEKFLMNNFTFFQFPEKHKNLWNMSFSFQSSLCHRCVWKMKKTFHLLSAIVCNKMFQVELNEVTRPINHFTWRLAKLWEQGSRKRYAKDVMKSLISKSKKIQCKVDLWWFLIGPSYFYPHYQRYDLS